MFPILLIFLVVLEFGDLTFSPNQYDSFDRKDSERIIGGTETTIFTFPYQARISLLGEHRCSGSIYKSNIIITAAHCVHDIAPNLFSVTVGTTSRYTGGERRDIMKIIIHENFNSDTYANDIALVFLSSHVDFTESIQPIDLARDEEIIRAGTKAYISGWGVTQENGFFAESLHYTYVTIIDIGICNEAYKDIRPVTLSMICASGEAYGGQDACNGDGGSPLVVAGKIYGYVSWGEGCAKRGFPRIYADVAFLRKWIDQNLSG